jgi:hypothetical protein
MVRLQVYIVKTCEFLHRDLVNHIIKINILKAIHKLAVDDGEKRRSQLLGNMSALVVTLGHILASLQLLFILIKLQKHHWHI